MDTRLIDGLIYVIQLIVTIYDVITYIPWYFLSDPEEQLRRSRASKARTVTRDGITAYRDADHFSELTTTPYPECKTLDQLFVRAVKMYGPLDSLGTRELYSEEDEIQPNGKSFKKSILANYYEWDSYSELGQKVQDFGCGLQALGQKPKNNICIYADTQASWMASAQACFKRNFPVVTLYATLGEEAVIHGIIESEVSFVITTYELLPKFKNIMDRIPNVTHLVYMEGHKKPSIDGFPDNVTVKSFSQVQEIGARAENRDLDICTPVSTDLAVIMYTSGSTGWPKGVMITHENMLAAMSGLINRIGYIGPGDTYIGFLPLAHVLEMAAELSCVGFGCRVGYSSALTLSDQSTKIKKGCKGDASILQPTLMASVPLVMDRLYKGVWEKINDGGMLLKGVFGFVYKYKQQALESGYDTPICDKLLFNKIKQLLGGKVRMMLSGGAPLSCETQRFMNVCFCCPVGQGYGLTETCGAGTVHEAADINTGDVGAPLSCNEMVLRDWEEGGYTSKDKPHARGEVLIGGLNVTMGYYKNPEKTAEEYEEINGRRYFCTGDIGEFLDDGTLKIIDRKKDLVKLQAGEYVSLGKVETALKLSPHVDNICVYADSSKMFTVALITPNPRQIEELGKKYGVDTNNMVDMCNNKNIEKEYLQTLQKYGATSKLQRFEIPQRITLISDLWTPDTGLVTDSFKLKRKNLQSKYQAEIDQMYA